MKLKRKEKYWNKLKKERVNILLNEYIDNQKENFIGKTFRHLKVIDLYKYQNYNNNCSFNANNITLYWKCICDCGSKKEIVVTDKKLLNNNEQSLCCKKCAYKYFYTKNPNKYDLSGDVGVGYIKNWNINNNYCENKKFEGKFYFDKEDYELIKRYTWNYSNLGYIVSSVRGKNINLHNLVMKTIESDNIIDHINRKPWINTKDNLRISTPLLNRQNTKVRIDNNSKITGVSWNKVRQCWRVDLTYNGKRHYYGEFAKEDFEKAVKTRLEAEIEWFADGYEPQRHLFEKYGISRKKDENDKND